MPHNEIPNFDVFPKLPLGGIDRRAMVTRLAADGPRVAAEDLARARAALQSQALNLPKDHAVLLLGASGGILRAVAIQLLFGEGVPVHAVHYDSEKLQIGGHHARALEAAAQEAGVDCSFVNGDATRPEIIADVVAKLRGKYRVVHLVNGIAAGATKRFAEHGTYKVRDLDMAFDPVRQIPDFSKPENLRRFGLVDVEVATEQDIERTYKYMGRSTAPWADALAEAGLLVRGESLVAFADYDYEADDPVYALGPLAAAKVLQRESMATIKEKYGARTVRLCYPAMNTTALGAIPGGTIMFALTAQIMLERGTYRGLAELAAETMPVFAPSFLRDTARYDEAFQAALPEFHERKIRLTPDRAVLERAFDRVLGTGNV